MAIERLAPFEEIRIDDKHHAVVGLQDAVIPVYPLPHEVRGAGGTMRICHQRCSLQ